MHLLVWIIGFLLHVQLIFGESNKFPKLILNEDFHIFNTSLWHHEININGGGIGEFQIYNNSRLNSYVKNGTLFIKPTLTADVFGEEFLTSGTVKLENCTNEFGNCPTCCEKTGNATNMINPTVSARLRTKGTFSFKYGKVEIRAKMPSADWTWPALWMLPEGSVYGTWPRSGEIDIAELRGNRELYEHQNTGHVSIGSNLMAATVHFGMNRTLDGYRHVLFKNYTKTNGNVSRGFDTEFHRYQLEWTTDYIKFSLDDYEIGKIDVPKGGFPEVGKFGNITNIWENQNATTNKKMAPFDQKFYLGMNVAVGGSFFPDSAFGTYAKPWLKNSTTAFADFWKAKDLWYPSWEGDRAAMQIDYVKVWEFDAKKGDGDKTNPYLTLKYLIPIPFLLNLRLFL